MNKNLMKYLFIASLTIVTIMPGLSFGADRNNLVSLVGWTTPSVNGGTGTMGSIAYERMFGDSGFAVGGRISSYNYDCSPCSSWSSTYHESGSGNVAEVSLTYHFFRDGFRGPFIGPSIGSVSGNWSWNDPNQFPFAGTGSTSAFSYAVMAGWDFSVASDSVVIRPVISVANWGGSSTDTTGTQSSSLGTILILGVSAGFAF